MIVRRCGALLAIALAVLVLAVVPVRAAAAETGPGPGAASDAGEDAGADVGEDAGEGAVAGLRRRAAEAQVALRAATADYERAQQRLAQNRARVVSRRIAAREATATVAHERARLSRDAAAAYRLGVPSAVTTLLTAVTAEDPFAAMDLAVYLGRITRHQRADVERLQALEQRAQRLTRRADRELAAAEALERQLARQAEELAVRAERASAALTAELERIERARAAARRRAAEQVKPSRVADYPNGLIPRSVLCEIGVGGHRLRCDAAAAYRQLAAAYRTAFGESLCVTDSYRGYAAQVDLYGRKPSLAAVPGTSNHGWGLAVDLCGGINSFGTSQHAWMRAHAPASGWYQPTWARAGGSKPEPWHWEFGTG